MRVLVVGGGISGLSTAFYLQQLARQSGRTVSVSVAEQSSRIGGWIQTYQFDDQWLFEQGPRSFIPRKGALTADMIGQLGLHDQLLFPEPSAKKRYVYYESQMYKLPESLGEFFRSPLMKGVPAEAWKEFRAPRAVFDEDLERDFDESIHDFIVRRFGPIVAERLIDPLVAGIYSGDTRKLSIRSCFPDLLDLEFEFGSVIKGVLSRAFLKQGHKRKKESPSEDTELFKAIKSYPLYSFKYGVSTLTQALEKHILTSGSSIMLSTSVTSFRRSPDSSSVKVSLKSISGEEREEDYDHVVFTISSKALSQIVSGIPSLEKLKIELDQIRSASLAVINIGYNERVLKSPGFGFLVPSSQSAELQALGVTYDSDTFPTQLRPSPDATRLTVMIGGDRAPELVANSSTSQLEELALKNLQTALNITANPALVHTSIARDCIAQYQVGHSKLLRRIEVGLEKSDFHKQVSIIGASYFGPAMNACIERANRLATELLSQNSQTH
eukprot:TRINITY_DN18334_c0_g1_i1.p1 TRINITY_DN18334_c0_g1~~TRINITY_DN18334_c0_g1_i1.p1  ORF type:complete len:498 (+),score=138.13 TRINITY_DN18334_c0_g1_i1:433-1926(+)